MIKTKHIFNKIYQYIISLMRKVKSEKHMINYTKQTVNKTPSIGICYGRQNPKAELIKWLSNWNHTHFLTIQLPTSMKSNKSETAQYQLRRIISKFEYHLLGKYWNTKHLPFCVFMEKGRGSGYHFHLLLNADTFKTDELEAALEKTAQFFGLSPQIFYLEAIGADKSNLYSYCTKEIRTTPNGHICIDNFILSDNLFNFKTKKQNR